MDLRKLKTLIDLVSDSNVSELEITEAEGKVRIVKGQPPVVQAAPVAAPVVLAPAAPVPAVAAAPAAAPEQPLARPGRRRVGAHPGYTLGRGARAGEPAWRAAAGQLLGHLASALRGRNAASRSLLP